MVLPPQDVSAAGNGAQKYPTQTSRTCRVGFYRRENPVGATKFVTRILILMIKKPRRAAEISALKVKAAGECPCARSRHAACAVQSSVYVLFGKGQKQVLSDCYHLNTGTDQL